MEYHWMIEESTEPSTRRILFRLDGVEVTTEAFAQWVRELKVEKERLDLQLKEATAFAYEEAARLLENEVIAGNQVAGVALSIGRLRLWAKDRRAKLKSKGVFCLEHSKVMTDGICPKCAGQPA